MHIHDTTHVIMTKHDSMTVRFFVILDVLLVISLLSMMFCLRPFEFTFVSEWMRQCKYEQEWFFLPYVVVVIIILVVLLQLNWMYLVSLCYCNSMYALNHDMCCLAHKQAHQRHVSRTEMLRTVVLLRTQENLCNVATSHSDAAFMSTAAVICGIIAVIYFDWTSAQGWMHFYGVFLFCSGFLTMLQIIWFNLQTACCIASLRSIKLVAGMHWMLDSIIILLVLCFLSLNFLLGQTGKLVVSSELIAFSLLMLQCVYLFTVCCRIVPSRLPASACNTWPCFWFVVLILFPFTLADNL